VGVESQVVSELEALGTTVSAVEDSSRLEPGATASIDAAESCVIGGANPCMPAFDGQGSPAAKQPKSPARSLPLANLPAATAVKNEVRVFVQRNGVVYFGWQDKLSTTSQTRLNDVAFRALAPQLGIAAP